MQIPKKDQRIIASTGNRLRRSNYESVKENGLLQEELEQLFIHKSDTTLTDICDCALLHEKLYKCLLIGLYLILGLIEFHKTVINLL